MSEESEKRQASKAGHVTDSSLGVPQYTEVTVQSLLSERLFDFSPPARQEIDQFYSQVDIPAYPREQCRALSYLHAAEYALLPALTSPGPSQLSRSRSSIVSHSNALLALLKGDCSLIIWTHVPAGNTPLTSLDASDLTAFSGDTSKIRKIMPWPNEIAPEAPIIQAYANQLEALHMQSKWEPAISVARSGVIQLQGLLWCLKSTVISSTTEDSFRNTVNHYVSEFSRKFRDGENNPFGTF